MFNLFKSKKVCPSCLGEQGEKIPNDAKIQMCKTCAKTSNYFMFKDVTNGKVFAVLAFKKLTAIPV
jgi:hypothetical protein